MPEICDYEGSEYATAFWGPSREYEDAVDRRALGRLLPPVGARLVEIGAGFGRLARLYAGYEEVFLVDYSRSLLLQAAIRHIRQSPPSRIVRSGACNVVTHYASRKMGCVIKAEARLTELAAIYEWDHDQSTYEFYDQPPPIKKIHVRSDGRTSGSMYTPDFFRIAEDFIGWVECKPEGWLRDQASEPYPQYIRDDAGVWRCPRCGSLRISETSEAVSCDDCGSSWPRKGSFYDFKAQGT